MTRAALTKLLILVILAFIISLPEFFTVYRVSKVNFLCRPYQPCEQGNRVKARENEKNDDVRETDMCDPSQILGCGKFKPACASNMTDAPSRSGNEDTEESWFTCETDTDMADLHTNISSSDLKVHFEMSVKLQLRDAETLNVTLYGLRNQSSLLLHSPKEEMQHGEEEQSKAFYCCAPVQLTSASENESCCLLWLANQTALTAAAGEKVQLRETDEWSCMFRVLWLVLLCVVLLTIVTTVIGQIYRGGCFKSKIQRPKPHPVGYDVTGKKLKDGEQHRGGIVLKETLLHSYGPRFSSELSPIQEADSQDNLETLLDGNAEPCHTVNLYHRSHSSTSSTLTEEQAWWQRSSQRKTEMDLNSSGDK